MHVYYRHSPDTLPEFEVCSQYFPTVDCRTKLFHPGHHVRTVICRYSALPFNKELEEDLRNLNCTPINSNMQHSYVADMGWVYDLGSLTFETWFDSALLPDNTAFVVKGRTNSRKFEWNTKMFAADKAAALNIMHELWHDPLICPQGIAFRRYTPLVTYEIGINSMPMTNEWRVFFYKGQLVDYGYYWASLDNTSLINESHFRSSGLLVAQQAADILKDSVNFFAVDIAEDVEGKWWVVEVNDAQLAGLSTIEPHRFYQNLSAVLKANGG